MQLGLGFFLEARAVRGGLSSFPTWIFVTPRRKDRQETRERDTNPNVLFRVKAFTKAKRWEVLSSI